jgi:hypothetical protein
MGSDPEKVLFQTCNYVAFKDLKIKKIMFQICWSGEISSKTSDIPFHGMPDPDVGIQIWSRNLCLSQMRYR